ncbi:hypothetical protein TNIN_277941 [Trichonephila inaurata madagascariensis]|uniref:Uncharacterized protein n=1 Tax=Trichonephila inaurata madagascariensis TaxID=2747483 RepID=A0A8X6XMA3_9ARAC|nr:hypothetical protein TNIN_277941 [Trichonephila inaurata madagascariensis]
MAAGRSTIQEEGRFFSVHGCGDFLMVISDSEKSLNMDISPSKEEEISACEKLRDTATVASQSFTKPFKSMQDSIVLALGTVYGSISVEHRSLDEKKRKTW